MTQPIKAVYFLHNTSGDLLYVGKSYNLRDRLRQHLDDKTEGSEWKVNIDRGNIQYVELESELDIELYETYYINILKPLYNASKLFSTEGSQLTLPDILQHKKILPFIVKKVDKQPIADRYGTTISFKDMCLLYIDKEETRDEIATNQPEIHAAFHLLGAKKMKALDYRLNRFKVALAELQLDTQQDLKDIVYTVFKPDNFYSLKEVKSRLQAIYDSLQMSKKAKATDLNQWFTTTTKNVKNTNGLYITT